MFLCRVFLIVVCLAISDGKLFRYDYDYQAEGWMKLHLVPATWRDARLRCFREDAVLASPETVRLRDALQSVLKNNQTPVTCGIFTGIHATYNKGDYHTIDGIPLGRIPIHWAPNEPDNADNNEDCLVMLPNGQMADVNCSDVYPYVCYKRLSNIVTNNCGTVDNNYVLDSRTGSCYKFHKEPQTWPRAYSACSGEGGHLAIINSETEAQVLKELYGKHPPDSMPGNFIKHVVHIGHTDWEEHGLWMTIHGQTLKEAGYDKWAGGQPDNSSSQFCGAMFNNGQLDDVWCDRPCPFICEKKPESLLTDEI